MIDKSLFHTQMINALGRVVIFMFDTVLFTCRVDREGEAAVTPYVKDGAYLLASWHGRLIVYFLGPRNEAPAAMASRSRDGEIAASIQGHGRYKVFRGSSRKGGGLALARMERYMRKCRKSGMLSVDGPTGPRYVAKIGAAKLASNLSYPMIPVSFSSRHRLVLKSWDRLIIPIPFSQGLLIYGTPIHVPKNASEETLMRCTQELEIELRRITEKADAHFGHTTI